MKKTYIIHPVIFAILPVFILFAHNLGEIPATQILLPTIILSITSIILLILTGFLLKNYRLAALILSPIIILFLSYGSIYNYISYYLRETKWYLLSALIVLNIFIIIGLSFFFYKLFKSRAKKQFIVLNKLLSAIALTLLVVNLFQIGIYYLNDPKDRLENCSQYKGIKNGKFNVSPDIYYIILDEYAGLDQIREAYNYDNSAFANRLIEKGFYIATKSKTKYASTNMSLAEALNMGIPENSGHTDDSTSLDMTISSRLGFEDQKSIKYAKMIRDNRVVQIFKCMGYKYINFGAWWYATRYNQYADKNVSYYGLFFKDELNSLIVDSSIIRLLFIHRYFLRRGILYAFDKISKIPTIEGSKFVFVHMLMPHRPFLFNENGDGVSFQQSRVSTDKALYLGQHIFTTKKVEKLIDEILRKSEKPPIIILQSDHGSRSDPKNKYKIFNAYYLPYAGKKMLYPNIMPGETFKVILSYYFDIKVNTTTDARTD